MVHDGTGAPVGTEDGSAGTIPASAGRRLTASRNATAAALAALPPSVRVTGATPASVRPHDLHRLRPARHGPARSVAPINDASCHAPARVRRHRSAVPAVIISFAAREIAGGLR